LASSFALPDLLVISTARVNMYALLSWLRVKGTRRRRDGRMDFALGVGSTLRLAGNWGQLPKYGATKTTAFRAWQEIVKALKDHVQEQESSKSGK
jgi:hypothetical protein